MRSRPRRRLNKRVHHQAPASSLFAQPLPKKCLAKRTRWSCSKPAIEPMNCSSINNSPSKSTPRSPRPPHSPEPVRVPTVHGAPGAKAISNSSSPVALRGSRHGEGCLYSYDTVSVQRIWYPSSIASLRMPPSVTFRYEFPNTITTKHHERATVIFNSHKIVVNYWIRETSM